MEKRVGHLKTIIIAASVILMSGCGILKQPFTPVEMTPETRQLLSRLTHENAALATFKGIGTIHVSTREGSRWAARVAWIGEAPDKLRLSVLNVGGLPTATMAADGHTFFLASQGSKKIFKTRESNPSLHRMIGIRLKTREAIQILGGRVPVRDSDDATLETDARTGEAVLTLSNRWGRVLEKIYFSDDRETVTSIEMFDSSGELLYASDFSNLQVVDGFKMPFNIEITDKSDRLLLQVQKYWPQAIVEPSTFILGESEM